MAGLWQRTGNVTVTNGSKTVTGFGTKWKTGVLPIQKGHTFYGPDNAAYEVDTVVNDESILLVDTYRGGTLANQAYRIDITRTSTISQFAADLASLVGKYRTWFDGMMTWLTGSGDVSILNPDTGANTTIPSWKKVASEGEGQAARAKSEADKAAASAEESKSAPRAAIPYMDYARYGINGKMPTLSLDFMKNEHRLYEGMGAGFNLKTLAQAVTLTRASAAVAQGPLAMEAVAVDIPRVAHRNGVKVGLLGEAQATNLMKYAHPLAQGAGGALVGDWYWNSADKLTQTSVSVVLPDGTTGPATRCAGINVGYMRIRIMNAALRSCSLFIRDIVGQLVLRGVSTGYTTWTANIDAAGVVTGGPSTGSLTVTKHGDWFRLAMHDPAASDSIEMNFGSNAAATLWGGQVEAGTAATSYIATNGAQVTRANDIIRRTLTTELNTTYQSAFTVVFEFMPLALYSNAFIFQFDDGTTAGPKFYIFYNASGAGSASLPNLWVAGESKKVAMSFTDNGDGNYTWVRTSSGAPVVSSVQAITGDSFRNIKRLNLMTRYVNTNDSSYSPATGILKSFAIFPMALTAAELVEITK